MAFACAELKSMVEKLWAAGVSISASEAASLFRFGRLEKLVTTSSNLRHHRDIAWHRWKSFREEAERLELQLDQLREDLRYAEAMVRRFSRVIIEYREALDRWWDNRREITRLENERNDLDLQADGRWTRLRRIIRWIRTNYRIRDHQEGRLEDAYEDLADAEQALADAELALEECHWHAQFEEVDCSGFQDDVDEANEAVSDAELAIERAEDDLQETLAEIERLYEDRAQTSEEYETLIRQIDRLDRQIRRLLGVLGDRAYLERTIADAQRRVTRHAQEAWQARDQIHPIEARLDVVRDRISDAWRDFQYYSRLWRKFQDRWAD